MNNFSANEINLFKINLFQTNKRDGEKMVMELQSLNYRENMGLSFSALNLHDDNAQKILCANFV